MLLSEVRRVESGSVTTTTRKAAQARRTEQK
jgi:hypothetical protein